MIEQFNFDIRLIFAILNGKVSAAINRKLYRNFRQNGLEISPEQWTVLIFLWEKDGVTQQELCNATFKNKPSMTRLKSAYHCRPDSERGSSRYHPRRIEHWTGGTEKGVLQYKRLDRRTSLQIIKSTKSCIYNGIFIQIISPVKELCFNL